MTETIVIAKTILEQLGGRRFILMTGAKSLIGGEDNLSFRIPASKNKINHVRITLNGKDLYDVEFGRTWGINFNVIEKVEDIYNDMLVETFETTTGLYAHF